MNYLILVTLFFVSSCSSLKQSFRQKELTRMTRELLVVAEACKVKLKLPEIEFTDVNKKFKSTENLAGVCYQGVVYLDELWWSQAYSLDREQVVFHEIGHCSLKLRHGEKLMSKKQIPYPEYREHKQAYLKDLFKERCI